LSFKKTSVKKSFVILLFITAISCSKNTGSSKFEGAWSGSYSSTRIISNPPFFDTGTLHLAVDANNSVTATLQSFLIGDTIIIKGTVDPSSGAMSLYKYGEGNYGIMIFLEALNGNLSVDSGSGTLAFPWASTSEWRAAKN
jgi:hypothetical protein